MNKEKRSLTRWELNCPARIRLNLRGKIKNYNGTIKDMNLKGFQFCLNKKLPENKILKFDIFLPDNLSIEMKAEKISHQVLAGGLNLYHFRIIAMKDKDRELFYEMIKKNFFPKLVKLWWKDIKPA